jgi:RNA:NAD 2'-phosphotransferase (TPT1/KptA family)
MNNKNTLTSTSKFMSLVLRHNPGRAGLALDAQGWVPIDALLRGAQAAGRSISPALLMEVVRSCPKQRFAISADGLPACRHSASTMARPRAFWTPSCAPAWTGATATMCT